MAIGSYRFSVSELIPRMTEVALQTHKKEWLQETPDFSQQKFLYRLSRSSYERAWGKDYIKSGVGTRILSTLLRYMPKVGPLKALAFKSPTAKTEDLYIKSINTTVDQYRALLEQVRKDAITLPNRDLDTGDLTKPAEYSLTDKTYATLLTQLAEKKFNQTSPELRTNILAFYSDPNANITTKSDPNRWQTVLSELGQLKSLYPSATAAGGQAK
jgi:hypothetical protein